MKLDLALLPEVLHHHDVAYVLIGGPAAVYHGSPLPTEDAAITPKDDRRKLDRLVEALRELNARIRTESESNGLEFACDAASLAAMRSWNFVTDAGDPT